MALCVSMFSIGRGWYARLIHSSGSCASAGVFTVTATHTTLFS